MSKFMGESGKYNHQLCYKAIVHTYTHVVNVLETFYHHTEGPTPSQKY